MTTSNSGNPGPVREDGVWGGDKSTEYDYVLRYIQEAIDYRTTKVAATSRAIEAYKGFPSHDGYIDGINHYANLFSGDDAARGQAIADRCKTVGSKKNMIVMRAIDSMVSQAQGGVGQYECEPYDKNFEKSPELIDALDAAAMDFYEKNHVDAVLSQMLEWAGLSGSAYAYLGYDLDQSLDNGRIDMQIIPDTEMLIDPLNSKRNKPRYIGHQTKASWNDFKNKLIKSKDCEEWQLQSINFVDTYINEVEYWLTKYNDNFEQLGTAMASDTRHWVGNPYASWFMENLPHHIDTFYKGSAIAYNPRNTKYEHRAGNTNNADNDTKYYANEIEVCYLYDLKNHIQFTVINRRFIVEAKRVYLQREIPFQYFEVDEFSGNVIDQEGKKKISIDHPYVELGYKKSLWETYTYSPIIHVLDIFDDICALETMIYHTISVMTPITFTGNPKDIEKLGAIAGVSGEAIKGFIANSVTVLNKAVDLSPAMSELSRLENQIMSVLHGVDPKEQQQMVGDRATAAEAMQAASLVSQGLNSLLANIEAWASDLAKKMFKMTVIYEDEDFTYDLNANGRHITLTRKDLAGDFGVRAVLKSKIKAERQAQAANTLQWFVPLMNSDVIVNKEAFAQTVVPTLAEGFTRKAIASWFIPSEEQKTAQEAAIELQKQQAAALEKFNNSGVDFRYVDPSSNGKYGAAEIARSLSGSDEALEMAMEDSPVGGPNKPQGARKLQYGVNNIAPEGKMAEAATPTKYENTGIQAVTYPPNAMTQAEEEAEPASEATLQALLNPTTGGQQANNPIYGSNAPRYGVNY